MATYVCTVVPDKLSPVACSPHLQDDCRNASISLFLAAWTECRADDATNARSTLHFPLQSALTEGYNFLVGVGLDERLLGNQ